MAHGRENRQRSGEGVLRFCMITTFYPPWHFGGDAIGTQRLARALVRRGHHVTVIHSIDAHRMLSGTAPMRDENDDGVETIGLQSSHRTLSLLLTHQFGRPLLNGPRIQEAVSGGHFDVIHFHNVSLIGGPGVLAVGDDDAVKLYSAHEHWLVCPMHVLWRNGREICTEKHCVRCSLHYRRPPQFWRNTGLLEREIRHIDAFIAKSEGSRRLHHEFGFSREMEVLPEFLPDDASPAPAASPHDRPYFLFAGRLEKIKGLDDLVRAFAHFKGADLLIAGSGDQERALHTLAQGDNRVRFLGQITPEALRPYFRHAIAAVAPSLCYETFGLVVIEAFREGTPVVARRREPLSELVEICGGGLLFENDRELVDALTELATNKRSRDRLGAAGRAGFVERWKEDVVMPRYFEIIRENALRKGRDDIAARVVKDRQH